MTEQEIEVLEKQIAALKEQEQDLVDIKVRTEIQIDRVKRTRADLINLLPSDKRMDYVLFGK